MKELFCDRCDRLMVSIYDGSVRKGIVVYCAKCHKDISPKQKYAPYKSTDKSTEMPGFLKEVFGL